VAARALAGGRGFASGTTPGATAASDQNTGQTPVNPCQSPINHVIANAPRPQVLANLAEMMTRQLEARWARQLAAAGDAAGAVERLRPLEAYDAAYMVGGSKPFLWSDARRRAADG
jgi:hypothetical protein